MIVYPLPPPPPPKAPPSSPPPPRRCPRRAFMSSISAGDARGSPDGAFVVSSVLLSKGLPLASALAIPAAICVRAPSRRLTSAWMRLTSATFSPSCPSRASHRRISWSVT
eukprot:1169015-Prorocentrum_minimum.AAC.1